MRITDVCAFYTPHGGGVRTYIDQKLALAEEMGHDITVIVPGTSDAVEHRGRFARIVTIRSPRLPLDRRYGYFADRRALHEALDRAAPDFVEVSSPWRSPVMVADWCPRIPKALIMHADPLSAYAYRWLGRFMPRDAIDRHFDGFWSHLRRLSQCYEAIVCANPELASRLSAGGVERAVVNPMGVESSLFSPRKRNATLRARMLQDCGLDESATLLLAIGRLAPEKRVPMLVEATTLAGRQRSVGLVILGKGRERAKVMSAIGGNPHIRLLNPELNRDRFAAILASGDALLHGCEAETFCMVAAEARASGIPVIVPDGGGAAQFAGAQGFVYRAGVRKDATRAIIGFAREQWRPAQPLTRTMRDHFEDLYRHYASITGISERSAA